ncbi:MAG: 4Fe-4S binding protein [Thermodesulfobacteriota bacterium]
MIIDQETCIGCGECVFTCTVRAISLSEDKAGIDRDRCVECGNCLRIAECPTGALQQDELVYPRVWRKYFSDNQQQWPAHVRFSTGYGRGTEECKTNDRTGRFKKGQVGILVELGRPGVTASFADAEKIVRSLIKAGVEMEEKSPITALLKDKQLGLFPEELRAERVLSCIVEGKVKLEDLERTLAAVTAASKEVDTVFSLGLVTRLDDGFTSPIAPVLDRLGLQTRPNAKINLGLGRPLIED